MKSYYERRITYNPETQNYHVTVPELGLEVQSDTEVSGLVEMREEVARASRNPPPPRVHREDADIFNAQGNWAISLPPGIVAAKPQAASLDPQGESEFWSILR